MPITLSYSLAGYKPAAALYVSPPLFNISGKRHCCFSHSTSIASLPFNNSPVRENLRRGYYYISKLYYDICRPAAGTGEGNRGVSPTSFRYCRHYCAGRRAAGSHYRSSQKYCPVAGKSRRETRHTVRPQKSMVEALKHPVWSPESMVEALRHPVWSPASMVEALKHPVWSPASMVEALRHPVWSPASMVEALKYTVWSPESMVEALKHTVWSPASMVEALKLPVWSPASMVEALKYPVWSPESMVEALKLPVWSPESMVEALKLPVWSPASMVELSRRPSCRQPLSLSPKRIPSGRLPLSRSRGASRRAACRSRRAAGKAERPPDININDLKTPPGDPIMPLMPKKRLLGDPAPSFLILGERPGAPRRSPASQGGCLAARFYLKTYRGAGPAPRLYLPYLEEIDMKPDVFIFLFGRTAGRPAPVSLRSRRLSWPRLRFLFCLPQTVGPAGGLREAFVYYVEMWIYVLW
jgi:hypothetical protein